MKCYIVTNLDSIVGIPLKLVVVLFIPNVCVLLWTGATNCTFKFIASSVMID